MRTRDINKVKNDIEVLERRIKEKSKQAELLRLKHLEALGKAESTIIVIKKLQNEMAGYKDEATELKSEWEYAEFHVNAIKIQLADLRIQLSNIQGAEPTKDEKIERRYNAAKKLKSLSEWGIIANARN
jgi:hypothetical protein